MPTVLQIIGRVRCNVVISGGTGSGKTTLLNCLTGFIDPDERIITCEDSAELQLQQPHVVRLETRPPNIEGEGEITMRDLVKNCLRMRPERIIVGEVRGPEVFDLLQAMNTGHDGSMGTIHANTPRECLSRMESMIAMGGFSLPAKTVREIISGSIDVIIQAARLRDGSRRITHITEVIGMEGDVIITQDLMRLRDRRRRRWRQDHRSAHVDRHRQAAFLGSRPLLQRGSASGGRFGYDGTEVKGDLTSMFGIDPTILAIVLLVAISTGAVAYGVLFSRIETDKKTASRINRVRSAETDTNQMKAARDRVQEVSKRRKSVQDSLKELEKKQQQEKTKKANATSLKSKLAQSGLSVTLTQFYLMSAVLGLVVLAMTFLSGMPPLVMVGASFVAGLGLPRWIVGFLVSRRQKKFLEEFPNSLDVMVRSIRSGLPLNDAIRMIASDGQEPVKAEFRRMVESQQLGLSVPDSVARMHQTMPLNEVSFFSIVIAIQGQAGGNLSEALSNLSRVLRDRKKMKAKVNALSMEAKASAAIIGALPFIVALLVYLTSPAYIMILFTDSRGHLILGFSAVWMSIGLLVMRNMINFEI